MTTILLGTLNFVMFVIILIVIILHMKNSHQYRKNFEALSKRYKNLEKSVACNTEITKKRQDKLEKQHTAARIRHDDLQRQSNKAIARQDKLENKVYNLSYVDLKEFSGLDPKIKEWYRKYFAERIMLAVSEYINRSIYDNNIDVWITENGPLVDELVDELIEFIESTPTYEDFAEESTTLSLASRMPPHVEKKLNTIQKRLEKTLTSKK
jgi:hypothetical protein